MPINFHTKVRPQKDEFILFFKDFQITKMSYLSCKIILHDINIYKGLYIEVKFDSNPNSLNYRIISLTLILFTKMFQQTNHSENLVYHFYTIYKSTSSYHFINEEEIISILCIEVF